MHNSRGSSAKLHRMNGTIGWREWVGLPDLGVNRIKAKIDTGARTSALHVWDLTVEDDLASFVLHPVQRRKLPTVEASARVTDWRWVRSSSGHRQQRPVIRTALQLGHDRWVSEMTLTSRDEMGFRLLLGRTALARRFVVDPARSFVRST